MKKLLFIAMVITALLSLAAYADTAITESSYVITNDGKLELSFDVETDKAAYAVVSSYDEDGRLISSKFVNVPGADTYNAAFDDYGSINFVKINVFDNEGVLVPLCEQDIVENFTRNGDTDIPVLPLFPNA